jgi:hypothetical protein
VRVDEAKRYCRCMRIGNVDSVTTGRLCIFVGGCMCLSTVGGRGSCEAEAEAEDNCSQVCGEEESD